MEQVFKLPEYHNAKGLHEAGFKRDVCPRRNGSGDSSVPFFGSASEDQLERELDLPHAAVAG